MPSSESQCPSPASTAAGPSHEYLRLLLSDGRLPTGAHTQSGGVEPAFAAGMRLEQVPDYLRLRLRTVTEVEAATSVVARHIWLVSDRSARAEALAAVDDAWRARTVSDALRAASDLLGRSYARMAAALWSLDLGDGAGGRSGPRICRGVVVGATAAAAGLSARDTARLVGFDDVQTVIAAALKIRPFDPALGLRWAAAAGDEVEQMVGRVEHLRVVDDLPAFSAPMIEAWAQAHATTERRLYRA
jgi:urease accessory protein